MRAEDAVQNLRRRRAAAKGRARDAAGRGDEEGSRAQSFTAAMMTIVILSLLAAGAAKAKGYW